MAQEKTMNAGPTKTCKHCATAIPVAANFCPYCQRRLGGMHPVAIGVVFSAGAVAVVLALGAVATRTNPPATTTASRFLSDGEAKYAVESWLKQSLRDPGSLEDLKITGLERGGPEESVLVTGTYRAKNGFGGYSFCESLFLLRKSGQVVMSAEKTNRTAWDDLLKLYHAKPPRTKATNQ